MRAVPLMDTTVQILCDYLRENNLDSPEHFDKPIFQNRQGQRLSRSGVRYILEKYVKAVRVNHPGFTQPVSPHCLRHTKGMHLLQSGVPLEIIRDFLGHVDVKTTQIYARANLEMKKRLLRKLLMLHQSLRSHPGNRTNRCSNGCIHCNAEEATNAAM